MSVRRMALEALLDITNRDAYANLRLKEIHTNQQDMKWISALVYEALDHLLYIDYILAHYIKGRQKPQIQGVLRLGACQMLFMHVPPFTACDESVKLVKEIGKGALAGFVNGVLRALAKDLKNLPPLPETTVERLSIAYSWPRFIVEDWVAAYGEAGAEALLRPRQSGMSIRPQAPFTAAMLQDVLESRSISYRIGEYDENCFHLETGLDIANDPLFINGSVTVQGEGAMLACRACGDVRNMRVLDACAAPGGKSAYLYALCGGVLELHSFELYAHRVELLEKTLSRLHVTSSIRMQDATQPVDEFAGYFDVVLLDAPCSGLGVAKPDIRYKKTPADIHALVALQKKLLDTCARYVRPGGVLVYATCTISREENEKQAQAFLEGHKEFMPEGIPFPKAVPGAETGMVQLLPPHTEGFFIARFRHT